MAGRIAIGLALLAAVAPVAWGAMGSATAHDHKFHAHVDAYRNSLGNFRGCDRKWPEPNATCVHAEAQNGNNGTADGFHGRVTIKWCAADNHSACTHVHEGLQLPHGYGRWMLMCRAGGGNECHNYLLGAVHMPNGPFAVMAGRIEGHAVRHTSPDLGRVEHNGGPLFLFVSYHSHDPSYRYQWGYVFGLRGWIHW